VFLGRREVVEMDELVERFSPLSRPVSTELIPSSVSASSRLRPLPLRWRITAAENDDEMVGVADSEGGVLTRSLRDEQATLEQLSSSHSVVAVASSEQ